MMASRTRLDQLPYLIEIMDWGGSKHRPSDNILEAYNWLDDVGLPTSDWYAFEKTHVIQRVSGQAIIEVNVTLFSFAFRHSRDAVLFKLRWA